jgi:AcrR family transcriptional regulator
MSDNDERRRQILDAAAAVMIRLGCDKTTMSDIAEEAGTSQIQYFRRRLPALNEATRY